MKELRITMGMPSAIDLGAHPRAEETYAEIITEFDAIDARFSTYRPDSELSQINAGVVSQNDWSDDMQEIMALAEKTKQETNGYFDIVTLDGSVDPSGLVKGWAIARAARIALSAGITDFYIEIGGDIQTKGKAPDGAPWSIGIRNPFATGEIVKVLYPNGSGVATSGDYLRGSHIYNPHAKETVPNELASLTVVGPDIYEADRFATAAFAMGKEGLSFIEGLPGFEAYGIARDRRAYFTSGFEALTRP